MLPSRSRHNGNSCAVRSSGASVLSSQYSTRTMRSPSSSGSFGSSIVIVILNQAAPTPIAAASVMTLIKDIPGYFRSMREPSFQSSHESRKSDQRVPGRSSCAASTKRSIPPNACMAARRASSGVMPLSMLRSVSCSTWKRISSADALYSSRASRHSRHHRRSDLT